jgi:hypothetical protein
MGKHPQLIFSHPFGKVNELLGRSKLQQRRALVLIHDGGRPEASHRRFAWAFGVYGNEFLAAFAFAHATVHRGMHVCFACHRWNGAHRLRDRAELFA